MRSIPYFLVIPLFLVACASKNAPAPIVDRPIPETGKSAAIAVNSTAAPIAGRKSRDERPASHTVKRGDTLYRIAFEYGLSYRDIASWNNLANQDDIKVDQVLRLIAPAEAANGVEVRPLQEVGGASAVAVPARPVDAFVYPKAVKLPYSQKNAENIGKQAEGAAAKNMVSSRPAAIPASRASVTESKDPQDKKITPVPVPPPTSGDDAAIAWVSPTSGKLLKSFTEEAKGVDIGGKMGQAIVASGSGKVVYAGSGLRGYGKMVIIKHNNAYLSAYAHNNKLLVKEGDAVKKGEKIAEMGNTDTDRVKLHFEIRKFGKPVDPTKFITVDRP